MKSILLKTAVAVGLLALTASSVSADPPFPTVNGGAVTKAKPKRQCFSRSMLSGFSAPDEYTLYVRVAVRDVWRIETMGPCPDMDWSLRLGLEDRGGGGWICTGDLAEVIVADSGLGRLRCPVRVGPQLTPEEIAALPKKSRP
jgi:hypothetical protein